MKAKKTTAKKVWIHGINGKMGKELQKVFSHSSMFDLVGGSDTTFVGSIYSGQATTKPKLTKALDDAKPDVIIDFSIATANQMLVDSLKNSLVKKGKVLIGTTGLTPATQKKWLSLTKSHSLSVIQVPNTSLGIFMQLQASKLLSEVMHPLGYDIEIMETHHKHKVDAPSGTAKFLSSELSKHLKKAPVNNNRSAKRKPGEIGVHAQRGGGVFGEHVIRIMGESEEILITHRAFDRSLFAEGAHVLAKWLLKQKPGKYELTDVQARDLK